MCYILYKMKIKIGDYLICFKESSKLAMQKGDIMRVILPTKKLKKGEFKIKLIKSSYVYMMMDNEFYLDNDHNKFKVKDILLYINKRHSSDYMVIKIVKIENGRYSFLEIAPHNDYKDNLHKPYWCWEFSYVEKYFKKIKEDEVMLYAL